MKKPERKKGIKKQREREQGYESQSEVDSSTSSCPEALANGCLRKTSWVKVFFPLVAYLAIFNLRWGLTELHNLYRHRMMAG